MALHPDGRWYKSSRCESFECVEVRGGAGFVWVRAGEDGPLLRYPAGAWRAFCAAVKDGRYAATAADSRVRRVTTRSA
jgi:Domain of unknown function (DUF397)